MHCAYQVLVALSTLDCSVSDLEKFALMIKETVGVVTMARSLRLAWTESFGRVLTITYKNITVRLQGKLIMRHFFIKVFSLSFA